MLKHVAFKMIQFFDDIFNKFAAAEAENFVFEVG